MSVGTRKPMPFYPELHPNIEIRVGQVPTACTVNGCTNLRSIYQLEGTTDALCRSCAEQVQATLNRLKDRVILDSVTMSWEAMKEQAIGRMKR